MKHKDIAEK